MQDHGKKSVESPARLDTLEPSSPTRRPYEAPRIERRIPIATNTMQPTSGSETQFPDE